MTIQNSTHTKNFFNELWLILEQQDIRHIISSIDCSVLTNNVKSVYLS